MSARGLAGSTADSEQEKGRVKQASVKRYWPGKAPDWYQGEEEEAPSDVSEDDEAGVTAIAPPVIVKAAEDPRLRRLAERREEGSDKETAAPRIISRHRAADSEEDEVAGDVPRHRYAHEEAAEDEEDDEAAREARRAAVRERLKRQQEQEVLTPAADEEEEEDEEEESEYETDSEDEGFGRAMLKPVFVPKAERDTIAEREAMEREEEEALERERQRLEARKLQTRDIVSDQISREEAAARAAAEGPKEIGDVDTDDEKDEEAQYEQWKSRELARIRRDKEEREREAREMEEKEALKNMTEAERRAWEAAHPKEDGRGPKKSWKFLQKYWHKGAFFQDAGDAGKDAVGGDNIFRRDFSAPTGDDKMDKSVLPKVMQVKNFGRRGRTKHTHLVDVDTSKFEQLVVPEALPLRQKLEKKLTGTEQVFEKPKKTKT
ncbi:g8752 [Coccomyxa elongata]